MSNRVFAILLAAKEDGCNVNIGSPSTEPAERPDLPPLDGEDPPQCERCHKSMSIPFGLEPTRWCNLCAQELAIETLAALDAANKRVKELEAALSKARGLVLEFEDFREELSAQPPSGKRVSEWLTETMALN